MTLHDLDNADAEPRLYTALAEWWPLLSPPAHYTEEAKQLVTLLEGSTTPRPTTILELGAGGGSLAFHLKQHFVLTLTDRSPAMLAVSQAVNPDCQHLLGDMRSLRLARQFDVVLIHDAVMYLTEPADVLAALRTAWCHCRPGGAVVVMPDFVKETFRPGTDQGGEDGADGRALRYLEWTWDPNPADDTYEAVFAFLLRHADGTVAIESDRHHLGLFARESWLEWMSQVGFRPQAVVDSYGRTLFLAVRGAGA
jgi:trans-aconitate methyltransferase